MTHRLVAGSFVGPLLGPLRGSLVGSLLAFTVAGCSLQTSLSGGTASGPRPTGGGASGASGASSASSASTTSGPPTSGSDEAERNNARIAAEERERDRPRAGFVDCSDREKYLEEHRESCDPREPVIVGLTVEAAKKRIAQAAPELQVKVVEQYEFDKECAADHVCGFEPRRWYVEGMGGREVTLRINRKLNLGPPE